MTSSEYPHLFSPLHIGPLTLKNRIEAAPVSLLHLTAKGYLTAQIIAHYRRKAQGGAALITVGEGIVHAATGRSPIHPSLDDPGVIPCLFEAAEAIHESGAVASIELSHGGSQVDPSHLNGRKPIGPSATSMDVAFHSGGESRVEVEEMSESVMDEVADAFATGAANVKLAGFDMCMIHAAHGWLLSQFLSPFTNKRTDRYGGSVENRARFPMMVLERVRERVGKDFPIEFRLGGSELAEGGYTVEDAVAYARMAESLVDLMHVSVGAVYFPDTSPRAHPSVFTPHGCNVDLAEAVRKAVGVPVVTVGGLSDPAQMEEIIATGRADMVAIARGLLADPDMPKKARLGREDEIVPCLRCTACLADMLATGTLRCAVNPNTGRELQASIPVPLPDPKKVLVAGGGPAGMMAAITAAERGHDVTLCEKGAALGGALRHAEGVAFKQDLHRFEEYLVRRVDALPITVLLNSEVTPEAATRCRPDVLIVSLGAAPIVPGIPGVDRGSVILAADAHSLGVAIGDRVVVVGGGQVGCETALHLAGSGKKVTIVEMLDELAPDANMFHRTSLLLELGKAVEVRTGLKCVEITGEGVNAIDKAGPPAALPCDTVVLAVGYKARGDVVDSLRSAAPEVIPIGDCVKPQKVQNAVRTGYDAGMAI
jgi:2,4-dienoyl-CoA reductase-like NADH-dependent reductase (Old Yellow Enzyme family)/thioredoxin reductase